LAPAPARSGIYTLVPAPKTRPFRHTPSWRDLELCATIYTRLRFVGGKELWALGGHDGMKKEGLKEERSTQLAIAIDAGSAPTLVWLTSRREIVVWHSPGILAASV